MGKVCHRAISTAITMVAARLRRTHEEQPEFPVLARLPGIVGGETPTRAGRGSFAVSAEVPNPYDWVQTVGARSA